MKEVAVLLMFVNVVAIWIETGKALNPKLDADTRKHGVQWALISAACLVINFLVATR